MKEKSLLTGNHSKQCVADKVTASGESPDALCQSLSTTAVMARTFSIVISGCDERHFSSL